jgi:hypothetical protein
MKRMCNFDFQLFCRDVDTSDDSFLDRLYEAGCDDSMVYFKDGYLCLDFSRKASSAEEAVVSAINDFYAAKLGGNVERVEPEDLTSLSEIANRVGVTRASLQKYARGISKVGADFPLPAANISRTRRELYSAFEVMHWMSIKNRVELPKEMLELCNAINKANQALLLCKAQEDEEVRELLARLTDSSAVTEKRT